MKGEGEKGKGDVEKGPGEAEIDALFRLAPPDFVAARNALVAQFKKEGRPDAANRVKAIQKPSISAWTVNQLYWRHRVAFDKLVATGERFRQAQVARLGGAGPDIRALLNERRERLSEMTRLAAEILQNSSGSAPAGVMHRITATLEAIAAYGALPGAPRAGRLTDDVDPPGFEALAALVPRVGDSSPLDAPSRVLTFQKEASTPSARKARAAQAGDRQEHERLAKLAAAKAARIQAEKALVDARKRAQQAQAALKVAATRAKDSEKQMVVAEARLQTVAEKAHEARQRARRAAVEAESAAQAVDEAELMLKRATQELNTLN